MIIVPIWLIIAAILVLAGLLFKVVGLSKESKELKKAIHELESCDDEKCLAEIKEKYSKKN